MSAEFLDSFFIHSQHLDIPSTRKGRRGEGGRRSEKDGVGEGVAELSGSGLSVERGGSGEV